MGIKCKHCDLMETDNEAEMFAHLVEEHKIDDTEVNKNESYCCSICLHCEVVY